MNKLGMLDVWKNGISNFFAPKSAQGYLQPAMAVAGSCGSSCGAKDDKPKPATACGAGDDKPKPATACGAGDEKPKPSACGSSCGAGDDKGKPKK
ncbi:hypothetical protein AGMMS50268_40920 [Spirochaetia bacterium]|nr:hypothetical protein AGMMS50268_40920 [Spirochaetia bacterium]